MVWILGWYDREEVHQQPIPWRCFRNQLVALEGDPHINECPTFVGRYKFPLLAHNLVYSDMNTNSNKLLLVLLLSFVAQSWPSYRKNRTREPNDEINTAMVHNQCCPLGSTQQNGMIIEYAPVWTHEWDMYHVDNCYQNESCPQPPYYPTPPPFANRNSPGKTYYDSKWRGSSQKEVYTERCIPIFPSFDPPEFPCDFYLVTEENKAYMTSKNAPKEFGDCCILAQPFHPPAKDFTRKMNFNGMKVLGGQEYFEYSVFVEESGGPFVHAFWAKPTLDKNFKPAFFYMVVVNNRMLYQEFKNYNTNPFDSESVFRIPDSCKAANVKMCPDFDIDAFKKHVTVQTE